MFNRKYIFKWWIFHCHVSFRWGTHTWGNHPIWLPSWGFDHISQRALAGTAKTLFFLGGEKVYLTPPTRKECYLKRDHFKRKTQLIIYFTYIIYKNHPFLGDIPYFFWGGTSLCTWNFFDLRLTFLIWVQPCAGRHSGAAAREEGLGKKIGDVSGVRKSGW